MPSRRQVIADILGALVSIALLSLSIFAATRSSYFSLPVPTLAAVLSILVALFTYPTLRLVYNASSAAGGGTTRYRRLLTGLGPYILLVLNVILITQSTDHVSSRILESCLLQSRWSAMFRAKNARSIRRIQDAMECCGFRTTRDMAWPFPDRGHPANACEVQFERGVSCEGRWAAEERKMVTILVVVGVLGVVFSILSLPIVRTFSDELYQRKHNPNRRPYSGLVQRSQDRLLEQGDVEDGEHQRISEEPYSDYPEEEQTTGNHDQRSGADGIPVDN